MAKENEMMLQAPKGTTTVAMGTIVLEPDDDGMFIAPESIGAALLRVPLYGIKRVPEKSSAKAK